MESLENRDPATSSVGGEPPISTGIDSFVSDLATYYMDFLETDFHKHRLPKRSIKYHDSKGLFLGLNLKKYEGFSEKVWKVINEGFKKDGHVEIKRGQFTTKVPKQILDLVGKQVDGIRDEEVQQIFTFAVEVIEKQAVVNKTQADVALNEALESIQRFVRELLIDPLIQNVEKPIQNLSTAAAESLFSIEEGLTESIVSHVEDIVAECINRLIASQSCDVKAELSRGFNIASIQSHIKDFFATLAINDLFFEIQELVDNKHILDKTEVYLYFGDIQYGKTVYPIFYVPLSIEKIQDTFSAQLDSSIYINKKALEYVTQEFNKETGRHGRIPSISKRILYPREYEGEFLVVVQEILNAIADYFQLPEKLDLGNRQRQVVRGAAASISNSCHLCIFDRSDEALVNDYEEILEALAAITNPLKSIFNRLIHAFIRETPVRVKREIQEHWDDAPIEEHLVYSSPIPINSEQRQILNAIRNENCRFMTVEGPPGTGKSHTITAIVFDAIRDGRSVLVLSDKKEALDVVEDKITETMNKVRVTENFQNPILRLGRSGNTYNQILSGASLENIRISYRAVKNSLDPLKQNIENRRLQLRKWIKETAEIYGSINIRDLLRFIQLEKRWGNDLECPISLEEFAGDVDIAETLEGFVSACSEIDELLNATHSWGTIGKLCNQISPRQQGIKEIKATIELLKVVGTFRENNAKVLLTLKLFESFSEEEFQRLVTFVRECEAIGAGWFKYLFKGKKLKDLNIRFSKSLKCRELVNVRGELQKLKSFISAIDDLRREGEREEIRSLFADKVGYLERATGLLRDPSFELNALRLDALVENLDEIEEFARLFAATSEKAAYSSERRETWSSNKLAKLDDESLSQLIDFATLRSESIEKFNSFPAFDYRKHLEELEELLTHEMTYILDKRLLDFYEDNLATAKTLRDNIKQKRQFPRKEFGKLKEAFPCIIAGIRDYAEYIPLEQEIFDLVIIDEASQVSIAQAFPALIRAKKVLVLGDRKQFSNVKSAHARSDTNRDWMNRLEGCFRQNVSSDPGELQRLLKFNIKTSILEFFEFISNFDVMLLKHFRGYPEHISYSSRYFYQGNLQAIKIRGKPIDDVLKFTVLDHDSKKELIENTNRLEVDFILDELKKLKEAQETCSVGIITPHTNQQKLIAAEISKQPDRDYYYDKLKLKVMTFDTCQGEERDRIYYSMVANPVSDRLWGIFLKDLASAAADADGQIKAQRLNVGFSRVKECMHFVLSKPIDQFKGSIREALQHYDTKLNEARTLPEAKDVDPNSPMEIKLLDWIKATQFFQLNSSNIELKAQFPIGEYLKQLDKYYDHPKYRTDFLLVHTAEDGSQTKLILEYDGFREHFVQPEMVNSFNYEFYYRAEDLEREKILEGYGYKFIRVNRFNLGDDPIKTLSQRLESAIQRRSDGQRLSITANIHDTVTQLNEGGMKVCARCGKVKETREFRDSKLSTGEGRICKECKGRKKASRRKIDTTSELNKNLTQDVTCPRCHSPMALRSGMYGKFYGCSRYPRCKGTRAFGK